DGGRPRGAYGQQAGIPIASLTHVVQPKRGAMSSITKRSRPERHGSQPPMPGPLGTFQTSRRILTISSNPTLPTATRTSRTAARRVVVALAMSLSLVVVDLTALPSGRHTTTGFQSATV